MNRKANKSSELLNPPKVYLWIVNAIRKLLGFICVSLAILLGLFATIGYFIDESSQSRIVSIFLGGIALLLAVIGFRLFVIKQLKRKSISLKPNSSAIFKENTGRSYDDYNFGDPPPTRKQFGYALHLGIEIRNGMTKWQVSDAIDGAIELQRSNDPASKEQLRLIKEYHGVLPRSINHGEANKVIEFLEDYCLPCPFCGVEIFATDDECCACNKSMRHLRIPIKL
jgi:hypothetical protein